MHQNRSQKGSFGCDPDMALACDPTSLQKNIPQLPCLQTPFPMRQKLLSLPIRQSLSLHVGKSLLAQDVIPLPRPQDLQKVLPTLASRRGKPGKELIADVGGKSVLALMPRSRVVHVHVARDSKPHLQNPILFPVKLFFSFRQD